MNYFEDFLSACKKLIEIDSVQSEPETSAPFGYGVRNCLSEALAISKSLGFNIKDGDGYYGYAEIGSGDLFGILGHLDTVPHGSDWSVDPLSGDIIDGFMYGRGMQDDKAPTICCLYAIKELIDSGKKPLKRIRVIYGCNEESGWKCMEKYVSNEELPVMAFTPDSDFPVINCEKGVAHYSISIIAPDYITSFTGGERANMVMDKCSVTLNISDREIYKSAEDYGLEVNGNTVSAHGVSAHGSTPHKGDNALWKITSFMAEVFGSSWKLLHKLVSSTDGSSCGIACSDEKSGALTINYGTVKLSDGFIVFDVDVRYPMSITREEIAEKLLISFENRAKIEINFYHDPLYVSPDSPLVVGLLEAYSCVTGEPAAPITIGGATYARAMPVGTCVAFGPIFPGEESTIHQRNERADIKNMKKMYNIYKLAIEKLCFE